MLLKTAFYRRSSSMPKSKKKKAPKKVFELVWAFESFEHLDTFYTKRMFGGMAVYLHGKMVMLLTESPGDREYRGKKYPFDIWHGLMFPTEYDYQESLTKEFPDLIQHPVLKKWLFLKFDCDSFEDIAYECAEKIKGNDKRFGIFPKMD